VDIEQNNAGAKIVENAIGVAAQRVVAAGTVEARIMRARICCGYCVTA
jgi:hypothetical protein